MNLKSEHFGVRFFDIRVEWELLGWMFRPKEQNRRDIPVKKMFVLALALLCLAGCGAKEEEKIPTGEMTLPESGHETVIEQEEGTPIYLLTPEWNEYDPSVESVWFTIQNCSGAIMETGADHWLETLGENGNWYQVPFKENVGWNSILMVVQNGGTLAQVCNLSMFEYDFSGGGTYRIAKQIGDQVCAGTFKLVEDADISAETPYGYGALEDLPREYSAIQRTADGPDGIDLEAGVIFDGQGAYGVERVETFLKKTVLGIPNQLRTVQDYGEGAVMVIDVIYENDHFLWRMWQDGTVVEKRFSYIVTDGFSLYLSNAADWAGTQEYDSDKVFLVPEGQCQELIPRLEQEMEDRLAWNVTRYQVWSEDGIWSAGLADPEFGTPTEFFLNWQKPGEGSGGMYCNLQDWDGLETEIRGLEWREDGTLELTCMTQAGEKSVLYYDPETGALTGK